MFLIFIAIVSGVLGYPQQTTFSPDLLVDIFGTPPPRQPNQPPRLEEIQVTPTTSSSVYKDSNGQDCQCVPYYLCDGNDRGLHVNNASVTGWGQLDIRFGQECQESVEKCCTNPSKEEEVDKPQPSAAKGCGYRNPHGIDFSVLGGNGNEAEFGEFPWVVAVLDAQSGEYAGVGVLLHPQVVMTGAHVAAKLKQDQLSIRAGEWDTQTIKERFKHQDRRVDKVVIREDFHPKSLRNDVALLHLQAPVQLDAHINVICMPEQDEDFDDKQGCYANGWGKNVFGKKGIYAVILKKVKVNMVPFDVCGRQLQRTRLGHRFKLHESFVCAGGEEGIDTCQGDGGAPLVCPMGEERYKLSGLVAWGIGCGEKDVPAVYVRPSMFREWVDQVMSSWGLSTDAYNI